MGDEETVHITTEQSPREGTETWGELNTQYLTDIQTNLYQFSQHLEGSDDPNERSQPSFLPPSGYWTTADKNRFFHALSVHSRLRPDLIAAEIPGKTIVDVCVYLQLLFEASADNPRSSRRNAFAPALEVSDEWIEFEECQAEILASEEPGWDQEFRDDNRALTFQNARQTMLRQKHASAEGVSEKEEKKRRKQALVTFQEKQEAEWRKDDYMGQLSGTHLRAIDNILREAEEPHEDAETGTAANTERASSYEPGSSFADELIDPLLLAISHHPKAGSANVHVTDTSGAAVSNGVTVTKEEDSANLSPRSRRRLKKRLHMRRKRAEAQGHVASEAVTKLKPGRKTNKKKHGRQSVQMDADAPVLQEPISQPAIGLDQAVSTLNPYDQEEERDSFLLLHGGKEELEIDLNDDFPETQNASLDSSALPGDGDGPLPNTNIGGLTLPYKIKQELLDLGYDATQLAVSGLGLFHLSNFERLMKLQSSIAGSSRDVGSCISAETLRQLSAEVVCFVTEVMQRTVAIHEQHRLLKGKSKVWRLTDNQIAVPAIEDALVTMGAPRNKKKHFRTMLWRMSSMNEVERTLSEQSDIEDQNEELGEDPSDADPEVQGIPDEYSSVSREIYLPFVWDESSTYLPHSSRRGERLHPATDDVSESEESIDADMILVELLEEDELDQRDLKRAEHAEAELWAKYADKEPSATSSADLETDSHAWALRFGQPLGVKSRAYIDDSD